MGVPPNTVARWEIGCVLQSCAADRFLRVLIAHPALLAELLDPEGWGVEPDEAPEPASGANAARCEPR